MRGAADSETAKELLRLCENLDVLIAVAEDARVTLGIPSSLTPFQSDADTLRSFLGKDIKSEKDAEKERKAAKKAAQKAKADADNARTKAEKAAEAATVAEQKASQTGKEKDKDKAEKKRQEANDLAAKAEELETVAVEAGAKLIAEPGQTATEPPAVSGNSSPAESQLPSPEA